MVLGGSLYKVISFFSQKKRVRHDSVVFSKDSCVENLVATVAIYGEGVPLWVLF